MRSGIINRHFAVGLFLLFTGISAKAQLVAHAGNDQTICPGGTATLGGSPTATGGLAPYTYNWQPSTGLSSTTASNPTTSPLTSATYTVTVIDDTGATQTDVIIIYMNALYAVNAGKDTSICENSSTILGGPDNSTGGGISYSWASGTTLNSTTSAHPIASPGLTSTTYTLTASFSGCPPKTDQVTISVIPTPHIDAGLDTTIKEGATATLHATGGFHYAWGNGPTLTYIYTANPNAEPIITTTYYLYGADESNRCPNYDSVTVIVEPGDDIVIYNTFTPNGDSNNDTWYIGNIYKYPDNKVEIYNRYGKLVYKASSYLNTWDGKAYGEDLPSGTYFYVLDLGNGAGKYHGTVTIIK
jgi:gliding motility-associated-like protein